MFETLYNESLSRAAYRVWILSDLQQSRPENTKRCLEAGITDFERLGRPADQIWYLGDAVEGADPDRLRDMCRLQEDAFASLGLPLCYATGNHDYDYARTHREEAPWMPFYETVRAHPGWKTTEDCEDFWFRTQIGPYPVYFLCDHISRENAWCVTHSRVQWGEEAYPYTDKDAEALRTRMHEETMPMITCGHCGFSGCNRDHALMDRLLPLPPTERIHFYGHSHIGDWVWERRTPGGGSPGWTGMTCRRSTCPASRTSGESTAGASFCTSTRTAAWGSSSGITTTTASRRPISPPGKTDRRGGTICARNTAGSEKNGTGLFRNGRETATLHKRT